MTRTLLDVFATPGDLIDADREDLGGIILGLLVSSGHPPYEIANLTYPLEYAYNKPEWKQAIQGIRYALAEAWAWLEGAGLLVKDIDQSGSTVLCRITRLGCTVMERGDFARFRSASVLPKSLVDPRMLPKVWPAYLRGDYDVAALQAFKEVEVAVREAANYGPELHGKELFSRAFGEGGPLTDREAIKGEQEGLRFLFMGASGFCRNRQAHREVIISATDAAREILFASYLLSLIRLSE